MHIIILLISYYKQLLSITGSCAHPGVHISLLYFKEIC